MKISIIIPVYNGENYLKTIIPKLIKQPYKNIELILVNDGSNDGSLNICNLYAMQDSRIIVIDKTNGGICSARNAGLKKATGEYVSFIDQDDDFNEEIYEILVNGMNTTYDIDMVIAGKELYLIDETGNVKKKVIRSYKNKIARGTELYKLSLNIKQDDCALHLWNCLYKKNIIESNNITFNENLKFGHEDSLFNIEYISKCKSVQLLPKSVYIYYRRANTSTSLKNNKYYINDFGLYSTQVLKSWKKYMSTEENKNIFFTYLTRLAINLYLQYGKEKEELNKIWNIINNIAGSKKITRKAVNSNLYYCYLWILTQLMKQKLFSVAGMCLKIKKQEIKRI